MTAVDEDRTVPLSAHYVHGSRGKIFILLRQPPRPKSAVLVVPPFAEEMNKSRTMLTRLSQALALRGVATVVPDLYGTGDSEGDFAEASWEIWQDDLQCASAWCMSRGIAVSGLLAIRFGAALAIAATVSSRLPAVDRSVLWQPTFDGARHLTQFLRLRVAALLASGASRATVAMLREESSRGETLEVAGYRLSTGLAAGLDAVTPPAWLPPTLGKVRWFEIVRNEAIEMPEIARRLIDSTRSQGGIAELTAIAGEPFWSSTEITVNRNLVDLSADFLAPGGELSANRGGP